MQTNCLLILKKTAVSKRASLPRAADYALMAFVIKKWSVSSGLGAAPHPTLRATFSP
jgi:hypothetical protein